MEPTSSESLVHIRRGISLLAVVAALIFLERARAFFIPLAFAALLTLCLNPLVNRLRRIGLPRSLGAAVVLGVFVTIAAFGVVSLQDEAQKMLEDLPASANHFRRMVIDAANDRSGWYQRLNLIARSAGAAPTAPAVSVPVLPVPIIRDGLGSALLQGSVSAASILGQIAIVLFLVYFLLVTRLPASGQSRMNVREILAEIGPQVQRFVGVLAITNVVLGLLIWLAFTLLGVNHAAVWGFAMAILHTIPYAGPAIIATASALAAAVQFESLGRGMLVAAVVVGLAAMVGIALTTWLTGKAARMNTATVFVGLLFWGWLWGLPGLLLGVPLMMTLKVIAERFSTLDWLSRLLGEEPAAPKRSINVMLKPEE